ncbi:MAG: flagellar biosynthetic protein FliO [Candidatus Acidiferrales bacterium]|jgi:flagellar biogenesis protein FliO
MKFDDLTATAGSNFWRGGFWPWRLLYKLRPWNRPPRKLQLRETVSLGNRGLLAVVQYQDQQFLLGCTNTSIAMLARLADAAPADAANGQESRKEE